MNDLLQKLGIAHPILLAPMGGGPGTPELAAAVSNAGGLGAIAGGYLTPQQIAAEIDRVRALTRRPLNVNLFVGGYHTQLDRDAAPMLALMAEVHAALDLPAPALPDVPPDPFPAQMEAIFERKPEIFSFTFGIPPAGTLHRLREENIFTIGTATTTHEAQLLAEAGVDAIVAQGAEAGAHRGTFAASVEESMIPTLDLVRAIHAQIATPVIASGGLMSGAGIADALDAGASAVQLGTAFLACPEAGTSQAYRDALANATGDETELTRAFSGRAARGIRNQFINIVDDETILPFPIQNSLTRPMRAAAAKAGNAQFLSLWAGTGVAQMRTLPAAELMDVLMREMREAIKTRRS